MRNSTVRKITFAGVIAAVYFTLTLLLTPISFGNIQARLSEALTLLALLAPEAIWGVTLGCLLANIFGVIMGTNILGALDIVIGTLATLLAGILTYKFRKIRIKGVPWLSAFMPVIFNGVFVGLEFAFALATPESFLIVFLLSGLEVAVGEAIACIGLGLPLALYLERNKVISKLSIRRDD